MAKPWNCCSSRSLASEHPVTGLIEVDRRPKDGPAASETERARVLIAIGGRCVIPAALLLKKIGRLGGLQSAIYRPDASGQTQSCSSGHSAYIPLTSRCSTFFSDQIALSTPAQRLHTLALRPFHIHS